MTRCTPRREADRYDSGWKLIVAIADPSAWIKADSALEQTIAARGTSVYLPGLSVPMLPEQLANERCSLQPDVERLALVCEMWIDNTGTITRYEFSEARVRSHAKLSYEQAAEFFARRDRQYRAAGTVGRFGARAVTHVAQQLQQQRARDHIVLPERAEYRAQFDRQRQDRAAISARKKMPRISWSKNAWSRSIAARPTIYNKTMRHKRMARRWHRCFRQPSRFSQRAPRQCE